MRPTSLEFITRSRLGHRGAILLILSVIDFAYGASLIAPSAESLSSATVRWREHYAPIAAWGVMWLIVGGLLLWFAFRRYDAVGYTVAIAWKAVWGFTTLASWAFGSVDRGWVGAIIWLTFGGMIAVISGWPEPAPDRRDDVIADVVPDGGAPSGGSALHPPQDDT